MREITRIGLFNGILFWTEDFEDIEFMTDISQAKKAQLTVLCEENDAEFWEDDGCGLVYDPNMSWTDEEYIADIVLL